MAEAFGHDRAEILVGRRDPAARAHGITAGILQRLGRLAGRDRAGGGTPPWSTASPMETAKDPASLAGASPAHYAALHVEGRDAGSFLQGPEAH